MKVLRAVVRQWPTFLSFSIYFFGVGWRLHYIFVDHPPLNFLYSDMEGYFHSAKNFFDPNYTSGLGDAVLPPGTAIYFGLMRMLDPTWQLACVVQATLSSLIPFFLAAIADEIYGRRAALVALVLASLYFPFVDYAAYILSENPCLFFLVLGTWLLACSLRTQRKRGIVVSALFAGIGWGVAAAIKMTSLAAALFLGAGLWRVALKYRWRRGFLVLGSAFLGLLLVLTPASVRATYLSEGRFCIVAHQFGYNFLLGHHGDLGLTTWRDDPRGLIFAFGSPSSSEREYRQTLEVPFGPYDTWKNVAYAWEWIRGHPLHALRLSMEHVFDLFTGMTLWPTGCSSLPQRNWIRFSQQLYWVFILMPAFFYVWLRRHALWRLEKSSVPDLLSVLPLCGLVVSIFLATGEPRYRIPFDGFVILLAARSYTEKPSSLKPLPDLKPSHAED